MLTKISGLVAGMALLVGCNQLFYQPMREIISTPDKLGVGWEAHQVEVPGGQKIGAWHLKAKQKSKAVIVHLHGNAENRSTHMYFVAWMTEADFDVIVFDYRGYGDSDGFASRASTVEDAGAIIKWVRENPRFKGLPLIAVGQSLGGAVAIPAISWFARQQPPEHPVDGLILDSTFSSYRRVARQKLNSVWLTWPLQWPLSFLVSDLLSPESHAADVSIPVLSFHSERDRVVPVEFGRELFQALASKEKRFVDIPVPGHTVAFAVESDEYRNMAVDFVNRIARQKSSKIRSTSQP